MKVSWAFFLLRFLRGCELWFCHVICAGGFEYDMGCGTHLDISKECPHDIGYVNK